MSKYLTCIIALSFLISFSTVRAAESNTFSDASVRDISIVVGIALGGAILGLSTLSFVEEPKDHLKNIVVGGAIGIIIGVSVVAWQQAGKSQQMYQTNYKRINTPDFDTSGRRRWHTETFASNNFTHKPENQSFLFSFSY